MNAFTIGYFVYYPRDFFSGIYHQSYQIKKGMGGAQKACHAECRYSEGAPQKKT